LGFGAAPIGNLYQPVADDDAIACVKGALDAGINYIDTAPHYGFGLSETRVGVALGNAPRSTPIYISTKVGRLLVPATATAELRYGFANTPPLEPVFDYSYDGVMRSFESSLVRLQTDRIDILFAHDLGEMTHGSEHGARFREFIAGGYRAMQELRDAGVVTAIGLGANEWQVCEEALAQGDFDCFLLAGRYTLLEQGACDTFFPMCAQRQVSVILGGPFNSGILATGVSGSGPFHYNYEPAPTNIILRVQAIERACAEFDVPLAAAALQFPAAHPQICSVIAGLANPHEMEHALAMMNRRIPQAFWQNLHEQELIHPAAVLPT
jgi:D-threo-aldose 1-dehydrogenase